MPPSTLDNMRGFRLKADADAAGWSGGINQANFVFSQGIQGMGSRGFDPSRFIADPCSEAVAELRPDFPLEIEELTQAQLYGFVDRGKLHNIAPVVGTPRYVDAASMGAGLRLGWLNSLTADLSITQVLQGQGVTGTQPVPGLDQGVRRDTRFFFILGARL